MYIYSAYKSNVSNNLDYILNAFSWAQTLSRRGRTGVEILKLPIFSSNKYF